MAEGEGRHKRLALAFVLIALSKQDAYSEKAAKTDPDSLRLDEIVVSLNEDFGQGFGGGDQDTGLVEKPAIVQDAFVWHVINPFSLRLASCRFVNAAEMAQYEV